MRHFERMLPTKKIYNYKMTSNAAYLVLLVLIVGAIAENRHIPARVLAKQTGATQFEEERFETHADCNEHKHHLKKRASDEDVDYEVYQGVVGRPGIDFPIYPRIPRTQFSCKSYGNGYFADMETDCQVFHICEDGRKISFLCPNGTIFQQSELTCDWWFKVNCLGSSGYYAESSEILNKQRVQRIRPSVPVQGFNIVGGGLNIKPKVSSNIQSRTRQHGRNPDRRIDSNEAPSVETVDFEDISGEKQLKIPHNKIVNSIDNNDESQIASESGSLAEAARKHNNLQHVENENRKKVTPARVSYTSESAEYARQGNRGQQRYKGDGKKQSAEFDRNVSEESREHKTVALPEKILKPIVALDESLNSPITQATTSTTYNSGAYSTSRRSDGTRATPYYTPTVPPVNKQKATQGKNAYVKGNINSAIVASTQNPNRLNGASGWGVNKENDSKSTPSYTVKPIVIGMRHHTESSHSNDNIPTGTPRTTPPTYLPRSGSQPQTEPSSAGEALLFAPSSTADESVHRNLDEMLKVMNNINDKFESVKKDNFNSRSASSTTSSNSAANSDLLHLSQYYAGENANSLYGSGGQKPSKTSYKYSSPSTSQTSKSSQRTSDSTFSATTASVIKIDSKADDINASLLSPKTVNKYTDLFGIQKSNAKSENLNAASESQTSDDGHAALFPQIGSTDATISKLAEKPESRSIAQVFSNALTTYLEDPVVFRQKLVSVRPTEPPSVTKASLTTVTSTDSSLFNQGTAASYLPTVPTTLPDITTTRPSIAVEINNKFEQSTSSYGDLASTTQVYDVVTSKDSQESSERKKNKLEISAEVYPNSNESDETGEILQKEQSSTFVTPRNKAAISKTNSPTSTQNPWKVSEHDFLDPLTINDGLMKSTRTTSSPITYISVGTTSRSSKASSKQIRPSAQLVQERSSSKNKLVAQNSDDGWQEIFNRYEIPADTLPSSSGLQRIANKLFGGLNETEALHLKNVMQQAEHNRQVLSLLLLLIQTCDDQNGRALERSRKHLLNALIDMDSKLQNEHNGKNSYVKSKNTQSVPTTTFRNSNNDLLSTTFKPQTTTYINDQATTTLGSGLEDTTKFEIRVEDPYEEVGHRSTEKPFAATADKRALELLKSLYSLASKFTSSR